MKAATRTGVTSAQGRAAPPYVAIHGRVDRILGAHDTTDVRITEHTTTRHDAAHPTPANPYPVSPPRTETHTFVNQAREFAILLEVQGRTLRLTSDDYLAAAVGDEVRALCETTEHGPLAVVDWHNLTRAIRFRALASPLSEAGAEIGMALLLLAIAALCGYAYHALDSTIAYLGLLASPPLAAIMALAAIRTAARAERAHAALDGLSR